MVGHAYSWVPLAAYAGFGEVLAAGAWAAVPVPAALLTGGMDAAVLDRLGTLPRWKLQLQRAVLAAATVQSVASPMAELDAVWDNAYRRLDLLVEVAQRSENPATVAAGTRLRAALLPPAQGAPKPTGLSFAKEFDYGNALTVAARQPAVHADVVLLGLGTAVSDVSTATRALAEGLGSAPGSTRKLTKKAEEHIAHVACVAAFNRVHDEMEWFLSNCTDSPLRTAAEGVYQTLADLVARYPAPIPRTPVAAATTPVTTPATGSPDVTVVPAGSGTHAGASGSTVSPPSTVIAPGAVSPPGGSPPAAAPSGPTVAPVVPPASTTAPTPRRKATKSSRGKTVARRTIKAPAPAKKTSARKTTSVKKPKTKKRG